MCAAAQGRFQEWKDFPKGLHVLSVISNEDECQEITEILRSCSYDVTACNRGEDALAEIQKPGCPFHAVMVEALDEHAFAILQAAKTLPVIMISNTEDIVTMMQAISLGAADFLQKPFSEEKLRNIWQHVARKAMLDSEQSIDHLEQNSNQEVKTEDYDENLLQSFEDEISFPELQFSDSNIEEDTVVGVDLKGFHGTEEQCIKLELDDSLDDISLGDGIVLDADGIVEGSDFDLDASIFGLPDSDSDSALNFELLDPHESEIDKEDAMMLVQILEEEPRCESSESLSISSSTTKDKGDEQTKPERSSTKTSKSSLGRKKMKVDWTTELHQKFVQAVEQLGVEKAIPSRILELMGEKCLTRHNVASHLQKYRSHRKHLMIREAEAASNWSHRRHSDTPGTWQKNRPQPLQPRQTPILPAPPCGVPLLVWGHPTVVDPNTHHMWQQPPWKAPDGTIWQHPMACIPPWGHGAAPGTPVYNPHMRVPIPPRMAMASQHQLIATPESCLNPPALHPPREVVDAVISEALTNPCTLPLGLKPPSMESVISELGRQGINIAPSAAS